MVYSPDNEKRYVILQSDKGYLTYRFEILRAFDADELKYTGGAYANWEPMERCPQPVFDDPCALLRELKETGIYRTYWEI